MAYFNPNLYVKKIYLLSNSAYYDYKMIPLKETSFVYRDDLIDEKTFNVLATFKDFEDLYYYCVKSNCPCFRTIISFFGKKRKVVISPIYPISLDKNEIITENNFIPYRLYEEYELMTDLTVKQLQEHLTIEQYSDYSKTHF